jgi:hypothetical protein
MVNKLSTKYNKAMDLDMQKVRRVAEYIFGCKDSHCLMLALKPLSLVSSADASYAKHLDGKKLESDTSCSFAILSNKQPVVAKSAGEAELIAQNKGGDFIEWARELLEVLGYPKKKVPTLVNSTCAVQMIKQGTGSFKRAKHIKVRFFWLKELIDQGQVELIYTHTSESVAYILPKPLTGWKFQYLLFMLGWNGSSMVERVFQLAEEVCWSTHVTVVHKGVPHQCARELK